uniref:Fork-head domain-containing protein n=1 Tax=Mesocestoides corti TaxID=53468 RepID=A0A5K3FPU7_MESCO
NPVWRLPVYTRATQPPANNVTSPKAAKFKPTNARTSLIGGQVNLKPVCAKPHRETTPLVNLPKEPSTPCLLSPPAKDYNMRFEVNGTHPAPFAVQAPVTKVASSTQQVVETTDFQQISPSSSASQIPSPVTNVKNVNDSFRRLIDDLFPHITGANSTCNVDCEFSNSLEVASLRNRLHSNLWMASMFDWSQVNASNVEETTERLNLIQRYSGQPSLVELMTLNEHLESIFQNSHPRPVASRPPPIMQAGLDCHKLTTRFGSANSSPQILPAIQDSFGPSSESTSRFALKEPELPEEPPSKDDLCYSRPTSWVQSILLHEDDNSKGASSSYQHTVTSYFEPISLDETPYLPPINDLQAKDGPDSGVQRVDLLSLFQSDGSPATSGPLTYSASSTSASTEGCSLGWESIA